MWALSSKGASGSANTIRVTVQLINAVTGFHLWSKTYDRNLGNVLKLQTEIATAVAGALNSRSSGMSQPKSGSAGRATRPPSMLICAGQRPRTR